MKVEFRVDGDPVGKQRPRFGNGRTYTPRKTLDHEARIRAAYARNPKLNGPLCAHLTFVLRMPSSISEKQKRMLDGRYCEKKRDIDNMAKTVLDALNNVAYDDDKSVVAMAAQKIWGRESYTIVILEEIGEDK